MNPIEEQLHRIKKSELIDIIKQEVREAVREMLDVPMNNEQAADYLNYSKDQINKMNRKIQAYKPGKYIIYYKSTLDDWIKKHPVKTQDQIEYEAINHKKKNSIQGG